jgi:hypothetical protein
MTIGVVLVGTVVVGVMAVVHRDAVRDHVLSWWPPEEDYHDLSSLPVPDATLPDPPTNLRCSANGSQVTLTWTNPQIYTGIHILREGQFVSAVPGTATSHVTTLVSAEPCYQLQVFYNNEYSGIAGEVVECCLEP